MRTLAILAALAALPSVAPAAEGTPETLGVAAVADPPGPSADLADLTRALRGAVADRVRGVLSPDELRQRMSGQTTTASLGELDRAFAGAVAAYQGGDYEGSSRTLRAVIEDLERLPESEDAFAQWSRAMLRLARAEGSLGRKGEAREVMERLVRANPSVKADPELYPPSFAKQLDEVRTALKAAPKKKFVVNAGGRAARVFLEGREVGPAPYTASLPPGRYRVSAFVGDVRVTAGVVDLSQDDQTVAIDFAIAETFRPDAGPGLAVPAAQRARGVVTAAAALKVDRLVAASVSADGDVRYLVGSVYDVRRGMLQREGRIRLVGATPPPGGLAALAGFLLTGESSSLVITKPDLSVKPVPSALEPAPGGPKGPSKAKGWYAFGAGVLGVGLAGYATYSGIHSSNLYDEASAMKNPDGTLKPGYTLDQYNSTVQDGDSARKAAIATGVGSAVALATSGVLGWLSYKQTGEVGPFRF